ncbi:MAG TPA: hypothetical protein VFZ78_04515 [Flavisolibacter sp.]
MSKITWLNLRGCLTFLLLCLVACRGDALSEKLSESNAVIITFYDEAGAAVRTTETSEKNAIRQMARFAAGEPLKPPPCSASGMMSFMNGKKNATALFFLADSCRYFTINMNDSTEHRKMSNEAYDFLQALSTGKNYY